VQEDTLNQDILDQPLGSKFTNMEIIENIKMHRFEPVRKIFWRNHLLSFKSAYELIQSLKQQPSNERLILKKDAEDQKFLFSILNNKKISSLIDTPDSLNNYGMFAASLITKTSQKKNTYRF
jgi:hypothetical protein